MSNRGTASPEQLAELHAALVRQCPRDIDSTTAQRWIENQAALQRALREALMPAVQVVAENVFTVTVDYSRSLAEMIAAGKYDVNPDITEKRFPPLKIPAGLPTKVELQLELVHFNRVISSDEAIAELKQRGLRPATLYELLAFGEKYPEEQRKYPIVALGSVWRIWFGRYFPYLWIGPIGRCLDLGWFGSDGDEDCRFLAVRES